MDQIATPETILMIGAGRGVEMTRYIRSGISRIIATEPDPRLLSGLEQLAAGAQSVIIEPVSAATSNGDARLRQMNLPEASSLFKPTGIETVFRGLAEIGTVPVKCKAINDLAAGAFEGASGAVWLHLRSNGAERILLEALSKAGFLDRFHQIEVECGAEPLYEGSASASDVDSFLSQVGFSVRTEQGAGVIRRVIAISQPEHRKLLQLEGQLEAMRADRDSLARQIDEKSAALEQLEASASAARENAEEAAKALTMALEYERAARAEGDAALHQAEAARNALEREKERLSAQLDKALADTHAKDRQLKALAEQNASLNAIYAGASDQIESIKQTLQRTSAI